MRVIYEAQQKFIPRRRKHAKGRTRCPWLTREVKNSIKAKEKAYKVAKINGKPEVWEAFKSEQRTTKKATSGEKMNYECKLASNIKGDMKSFFQYIKGKREAKIDIGPLENEAGEIIIGNKKMAEELNSY